MNGERITRHVRQEWYYHPNGSFEPYGWKFEDGEPISEGWYVVENIDWDEHNNPTHAIARLRTHQIMPGEGELYPLDATNPFPLDATNPFPMTTEPLLFTPRSTTVPYKPKMWWKGDPGTQIPVDTTQQGDTYYQKLTRFQKEVADALVNLGYVATQFGTYERVGWGIIDPSKFSRWSHVLMLMFEQGKHQKGQEIRRLLDI